MFFRPLLIPLLLLALAPAAFSQGAAPSGGVVSGTPRLSAPGRSGATLPQDNRSPTPESPLMPDQTPSLVKPEALPGEAPAATPAKKPVKLSSTETFEADLAQKIRFRQVHTEALADRHLMELWDKANVARKDIDKRNLMREYYKQLYARMLKIDPSLTTVVALQALNAERRLTQVRITPTVAGDEEGDRSTSGRVFAE